MSKRSWGSWPPPNVDRRLIERMERKHMPNLIHRLEAAEGPSRELDGEIWCAANGLEFHSWDGAGVVWLENGSIRHQPSDRVKEFSASLDAAVSLVPQGWRVHEFQEADDGRWRCRVVRAQAKGGDSKTGGYWRATPALALCIAALKARKAKK